MHSDAVHAGGTTKADQTPMGEVGSALETLSSCATALEEIVMKCHTNLLGEFEFHPVPESDSTEKVGQLSTISLRVATTRRQIQRCIEVMESMDNNTQ